MDLQKGYSHKEVEQSWYEKWISMDVFRADSTSEKPPFCIVIPPPNVTGHLHMGHALTFAIQDMIVRYKRMSGFNTLWLPGTDHAGIATQMVVERELAKKGISRFDLGREAFIAEVWKWKESAHSQITKQMKALGVSVDWSRERFTLDQGLSRAVREAFVRLYREGLIYRDYRMVNWSPAIKTVISDLEVIEQEVMGHLWYIAYPVEDSNERLIVATTRPETMLGDTAIAVHPDDQRYIHLIGKRCILPLADRPIPIIADSIAVDPRFGTGAVKVTPGHDFADFEIGQRHHLPIISIFTEDAKLNDNVPERYRGMDRFACRELVVADLRERGLLVKIEDYPQKVPTCQRSGVVVEPTVSLQWFVKTKSLAEEAIRAVKEGRTTFIPRSWEKTYFSWMENIRDWCISRQLWWGHQIPVWYCQTPSCDGMYVDTEPPRQETICEKCGGSVFKQDEDVLDTWFSSALWPFSTLGWPDDTDDLRTFYPTTVMETGFDIIFFWVARMMMMGLHFMKDVPFRTVYLHAMVRDEEGKKMSKTKGNVIDPLEMVDEVGADALRFTLIALTQQGRDVKISQDRVRGFREFVNKLWNAGRFVLMNIEDHKGDASLEYNRLDMTDKWILTRLSQAMEATYSAIEQFEFSEAVSTLYQFIWHRLCDWYLEVAKIGLAEGGERRRVVQDCLIIALEMCLRALHPVMPFITEELWQKLRPYLKDMPKTIVIAPYPTGKDIPRFEDDANLIDKVFEVISAIRGMRSEVRIPPSEEIPCVLRPLDKMALTLLSQHEKAIRKLARLSSLVIDENGVRPPDSVWAVTSLADCFIMVGKERLEEAKNRIERGIIKTEKELLGLESRLGNQVFREKAPQEVVIEMEAKARELRGSLERLRVAKKALEM